MGTVTAFPAAHPLSYVRVRAEHGGVHIASLVHYERYAAARREMPNVESKLVGECTVRLRENVRPTTEAVTCGYCAPYADRYPGLDVTADVIAGCIA
jgi:hypothetical protein